MATKRSVLLQRLAQAREAKATKKRQNLPERSESPSKPQEGHEPAPEREVPTDGQRELAKACAVDAMVMGWDKAVQKHAYENRISEEEMKNVLDEAAKYNDKADPSGRIDELEDWEREKMGRSELSARSLRPS